MCNFVCALKHICLYMCSATFNCMHTEVATKYVLFDYIDDPDAYIKDFQDDDVVYAFMCLFNELRDLFSEVNFMKLKNVCTLRGTLLPATFKQQVRAAVKLDDLLEALDNPLYCNWLNIRVLKRIVKAIKIQRAINLIQAYEEHVYSRKVSEVEEYLDLQYFKESHVSLVSAKIVRSFESLTVADIVKFCEKLEGITGVFGSVTATECQPGCLLITCVIPMQCALHAYLTAKANFLQFRKFHIHYIEIELFPKIYALKFSDELGKSASGKLIHIATCNNYNMGMGTYACNTFTLQIKGIHGDV